MGCFFPPARRGRGDRLPTADAPFAILKPPMEREIEKFIIRQPPMGEKWKIVVTFFKIFFFLISEFLLRSNLSERSKQH